MTDEKRNRLIVAVTINVILLIVILAVVCIYQLVNIVSLNKITKDLKGQIEYYEQQTEDAERTLEYYQSEEGLRDLAYKYGFVFGK